MDASALESEISKLETRSESLERWLTFWIVLVVIGLVVEVVMVVKGHFNYDPSRSLSKLLLELLGPVLITIGVTGELGVHFKAGKVSTGLRNAHNEVVGLLNKQTEEIRTKNLVLQTEILNLQEKMADRKLSVEQANNIITLILPFSGQHVDVFLYGQVPEISTLANMICFVLKFAGWHSETRTVLGQSLSGIVANLVVNADLVTRSAGEALISALRNAQLSVESFDPFEAGLKNLGPLLGIYRTDPKAGIRLHIGSKP